MGLGRIFKVRRFTPTNPRVKAAFAKYYKPYARLIEMGTMPVEKVEEININMFLDVCLVTWEGIEDENKKPIPYSREVAFDIFKAAPDLFETLWKFANNYENYRAEVGNS